MAIQDKTLSAAEHDYYVTTSGLAANAPLTEHKRRVFIDVAGVPDAPGKPLSQMEMEAIHKYGTTASSVPMYDAWVAAAQTLLPGGFLIPTNASLNHIKFLFYTGGGFV